MIKNFARVAILLLLGLITACYDSNHNKVPYNKAKHSGFVSVEAGKLYYQKFGYGEPVILVHGGPGMDQTFFQPHMFELAKDHELIFYDQRGSGKSLEANIDLKYLTLDQFVEDLEKFRQDLGIKKFILIGHSWGGFLSMAYATKHPQTVSKLVIFNSLPADYEGRMDFLKEFDRRTAPIKEEIKPLFTYESLSELDEKQINDVMRKLLLYYFADPKKASELTLNSSKESALNGFRVRAEITRNTWLDPEVNLLPALKNLKVPTLLYHGEQDLIPKSAMQKIKDAIPNSKLIVYENCGHSPFIEKSTETFESLRSFLESK